MATHLPVNGYLDFPKFLAIMNKAAAKILVKVFFFVGICSDFAQIKSYKRNTGHTIFNFKIRFSISFMVTAFKAKLYM